MIILVYLFVRAIAFLFFLTLVAMAALVWLGIRLIGVLVGGLVAVCEPAEVSQPSQAKFSDRR